MNTRLLSSVLIALLAVSVAGAGYLYSSNANLQSANANLQKQATGLNQTITSLNGQVSNLNSTLSSRNYQVANLTSQLSVYLAQINALNGQVATLNASVISLTALKTQLQAQLNQDEANLTSMGASLKANVVTISGLNANIAGLTSQLSSDNTQIASLQSQAASLQALLNLSNATTLVTSQAYTIPAPTGSTCNSQQIYMYKPAYSGYLTISGASQKSAVYFYLYVTYGTTFAATTLGAGAFSEYFTTGAPVDVSFSQVNSPVYVTLVNCDGHNAAAGTVSIVSHT